MRWLPVLVVTACSAFAQGTTSRVLGVVQDPSGAAVPGALVQLIHEGTRAAFSARTSESGAYAFEAVQSGSYTVTVEAAGFKKFVARGTQVAIGQPTTVNVTLEVGALAEQIEVSAAYEAVQTSTSGNIGNLFTDRMIRDLPLVGTRGRNPLALVLLQPGVVSGANTGGGVHVHGARDRAWNFTLDGIDVNETSAGGSNFSPLRSNPDSLAEFRTDLRLHGRLRPQQRRAGEHDHALGLERVPRLGFLVLPHAPAERQRMGEQSERGRQAPVRAAHLGRQPGRAAPAQ